MNESVKELREVIEQLNRTREILESGKNKPAMTFFAEGYNMATEYAISLTELDIEVIESKIKLIES